MSIDSCMTIMSDSGEVDSQVNCCEGSDVA